MFTILGDYHFKIIFKPNIEINKFYIGKYVLLILNEWVAKGVSTTFMTLLPSFAECKVRIEQIPLFSCCVALTIAPSALRKLKIMQWEIIVLFVG